MAYKMNCVDDGFLVQSKNKDEVIDIIQMHIEKMHPNSNIKPEEIEKKIEEI